MTRKRLGSIDRQSVTELRGAAEQTARERRGVETGKAPPIAQMAGSAARSIEDEIFRLRQENDELQGNARQWAEAKNDGLVVQLIPLAEIDTHALSRDRRKIDEESEAWSELKSSLLSRGQQVPIEVAAFSSDKGYGLISGYRRLSALKALYEQTGDERFATVKALVSRTRDTVDAMIAMIEENEIRQEVSFYDRGRICCVAAEQRIFDDVDDAIQVLFSNSSRNRRYKIRNFTVIHKALGACLDFPEHIGERLGARLAQALKEGRGAELVGILSDRDKKFPDPSAELQLLEDFVGKKGAFSSSTRQPAADAVTAEWRGPDRMGASAVVKKGAITVKLDGISIESRSELQDLLNRIGAALSREN